MIGKIEGEPLIAMKQCIVDIWSHVAMDLDQDQLVPI